MKRLRRLRERLAWRRSAVAYLIREIEAALYSYDVEEFDGQDLRRSIEDALFDYRAARS